MAPLPLQSRMGKEIEPHKYSVIDLMWTEFSFCRLSEFWLFYSAIPMLLPRRFPLKLPHAPVALSPRRFWPLLAFVLWSCGWIVGCYPWDIIARSVPNLLGAPLPVQVLTLYFLQCNALGVMKAAPVGDATQASYGAYMENIGFVVGAKQLRRFGILRETELDLSTAADTRPGIENQCWGLPMRRPPVWSLSLVCLDLCGVVYCTVLVLAIAALVPRRRTRFLTTAGAGSMAVYYLQGILFPFFASPLYHILTTIWVSEPSHLPSCHPTCS